MNGVPAIVLACVVGSAALQGCGRVADYAKVVEANRRHERGDYQAAIAAYLGARRASFPATIDYDVANTYARLGEYDAASDLYAAAIIEGDRQTASDAHFNEGVALFERGRYRESWKAFRSALASADPESGFARDARRNLELAWRAWKKSLHATPRGISASARGESTGDETELRLLQRLETGRWRPGSPTGPQSGTMDY